MIKKVQKEHVPETESDCKTRSNFRALFYRVSRAFGCDQNAGLEKSAAIRPFATKKSRLASEKILLEDSLATESCRLADMLATKFFQSEQRRCGPNVIGQGTWQSLSVQDARELAVRAPSIVFASKSTPRV